MTTRDPKTGRFVKDKPDGTITMYAPRGFERRAMMTREELLEEFGVAVSEEPVQVSADPAEVMRALAMLPADFIRVPADVTKMRADAAAAYVKARWPEAYRDPSAPEPRRPWYRRAIGWLVGE